MESEAALLRLQTAITMGVKKLIVEGDSKIVIDAMKEPLEECQTDIRNCISDCKGQFKYFDIIIMQHVCRNKN